MASLLISKGADINSRNIDGYTPLNYCITNKGTTETASLLISKGADIHSKDRVNKIIVA